MESLTEGKIFSEDTYNNMIRELFVRFPSFQKVGAGAYKPGLERMEFFDSLAGHPHRRYRTIHVAGTNGKGSTCALLESVLRYSGYRVGMHTSPHLLRFNERCVIAGDEVDDDTLIEAFKEVEKARGDKPLTYFEFTGLAILRIFQKAHLDAVILEIGLGGRLDAMNAIDTDCVM